MHRHDVDASHFGVVLCPVVPCAHLHSLLHGLCCRLLFWVTEPSSMSGGCVDVLRSASLGFVKPSSVLAAPMMVCCSAGVVLPTPCAQGTAPAGVHCTAHNLLACQQCVQSNSTTLFQEPVPYLARIVFCISQQHLPRACQSHYT
jgi:hypothetical protein